MVSKRWRALASLFALVALSGTFAGAQGKITTPLRSGRAWGQSYLNGTVAIVEANMGKSQVFLFDPEVAFRGQSHGTFKFLFNGIFYNGGGRTVTAPARKSVPRPGGFGPPPDSDNLVVVVVSDMPVWGDVSERREDGQRSRLSTSAVCIDTELEQIQH